MYRIDSYYLYYKEIKFKINSQYHHFPSNSQTIIYKQKKRQREKKK